MEKARKRRTNNTVPVQFYVSPELYAVLDNEATQRNTTISQVLREELQRMKERQSQPQAVAA